MKSLYADILFKNITIISPAQVWPETPTRSNSHVPPARRASLLRLEQSVGVILANESTPMQNVVFEVRPLSRLLRRALSRLSCVSCLPVPPPLPAAPPLIPY